MKASTTYTHLIRATLRLVTGFAFLLSVCDAHAQVPATDLYLFQLAQDDTSRWHIHSPQYLSGFNKGGYTNQPEFIGNNLLYVSARKTTSEQNDIYALNISNRSVDQVTATPQGEYSPTALPDGKRFSCIREILGDEVNQQLFVYPMDRSSNGQTLDRRLRTVGYQCWLSADMVAFFLVGDPMALVIYDINTGRMDTISNSAGRALKKSADGDLIYIEKGDSEAWSINRYRLADKTKEYITSTPKGREDFVIANSGHIFMGDGSVLMAYDPTSNEWYKVFDLAIYGIGTISRLAMNSRNQIAIVSSNGQ